MVYVFISLFLAGAFSAGKDVFDTNMNTFGRWARGGGAVLMLAATVWFVMQAAEQGAL